MPLSFDHYTNSLLYISATMPFPSNKDKNYIQAVVDETEKIIKASHGHAAVLFTSYRAMDMVFEILAWRNMGFPLFRLDRGGSGAIERFRHSGNGVLFASGAMWVGIGLQGDILSMLIILRLPDPISEYERTLYRDMEAYKNAVIKPEMVLRSKQGHGRALRSEKDTAVIVLLNIRASESAGYREYVLESLPDCRVTADLADVENFIKTNKPPAYFL